MTSCNFIPNVEGTQIPSKLFPYLLNKIGNRGDAISAYAALHSTQVQSLYNFKIKALDTTDSSNYDAQTISIIDKIIKGVQEEPETKAEKNIKAIKRWKDLDIARATKMDKTTHEYTINGVTYDSSVSKKADVYDSANYSNVTELTDVEWNDYITSNGTTDLPPLIQLAVKELGAKLGNIPSQNSKFEYFKLIGQTNNFLANVNAIISQLQEDNFISAHFGTLIHEAIDFIFSGDYRTKDTLSRNLELTNFILTEISKKPGLKKALGGGNKQTAIVIEDIKNYVIKYFEKFLTDDYFVVTELRVADEEVQLAGTFDIMIVNKKTGHTILFDTKTSKKSVNSSAYIGKLSRYAAQMAYYTAMLQKGFDTYDIEGVEIDEVVIIPFLVGFETDATKPAGERHSIKSVRKENNVSLRTNPRVKHSWVLSKVGANTHLGISPEAEPYEEVRDFYTVKDSSSLNKGVSKKTYLSNRIMIVDKEIKKPELDSLDLVARALKLQIDALAKLRTQATNNNDKVMYSYLIKTLKKKRKLIREERNDLALATLLNNELANIHNQISITTPLELLNQYSKIISVYEAVMSPNQFIPYDNETQILQSQVNTAIYHLKIKLSDITKAKLVEQIKSRTDLEELQEQLLDSLDNLKPPGIGDNKWREFALSIRSSRNPLAQLVSILGEESISWINNQMSDFKDAFTPIYQAYYEKFGNNFEQFLQFTTDVNGKKVYTGNVVNRYRAEFYEEFDTIRKQAYADKEFFPFLDYMMDNLELYDLGSVLDSSITNEELAKKPDGEHLLELRNQIDLWEKEYYFYELFEATDDTSKELKEKLKYQNPTYLYDLFTRYKNKEHLEPQEIQDLVKFTSSPYNVFKIAENSTTLDPQYDVIMGNTVAADFYNFYMEQAAKNYKVTPHNNKLTRLEQPSTHIFELQKMWVDEVSTDGYFKAFLADNADAILGSITSKLPENNYGDTDPLLLKSQPDIYLPKQGQIKPEDKSTNLAYVLLVQTSMAKNFEYKSKVTPTLNFIKGVIEESYEQYGTSELKNTLNSTGYYIEQFTGKQKDDTWHLFKTHTEQNYEKLKRKDYRTLNSADKKLYEDLIEEQNKLVDDINTKKEELKQVFEDMANIKNLSDSEQEKLKQKYFDLKNAYIKDEKALSKTEREILKLGGSVTINKTMNMVNNVMRKIGLSLRLTTVLTDVISTGANLFMFMNSGEYYKTKGGTNWGSTYLRSMKDLTTMYISGNYKKIDSLYNKLGIKDLASTFLRGQNSSAVEELISMQNNGLGKLANKSYVLNTARLNDLAWSFHSVGHYMNTYPVITYVLSNNFMPDGETSIYKALIEGDLDLNDPNNPLNNFETFSKISREIKEMIRLSQGNYDSTMKEAGNATVLGKLLFTFKKWMPQMIENRFGAEIKGYKHTKGRYISLIGMFGRSMQKGAEAYKNGGFLNAMGAASYQFSKEAIFQTLSPLFSRDTIKKQLGDNVADVDVYNFRKNVMEAGFLGFIFLLGNILLATSKGGGEDDEYDDDKIQNFAMIFALNQAGRVFDEGSTFFQEKTWSKLLNQTIPLFDFSFRIIRFLLNDKGVYSSGYRKGESKTLHFLWSNTPMVSGLMGTWEAGNYIRSDNRFLEAELKEKRAQKRRNIEIDE